MSPADLADDADKPQNYNNPKTKLATNCLYLRDNAACCIPLRNQRYLRENIHIRGLYQLTKIPQETLTTNCLSLRNNAACGIPLCVICVICGRIFTQAYSINPYKQKYLTLIPQTNHKNEQYRNCINTRIRSQYF